MLLWKTQRHSVDIEKEETYKGLLRNRREMAGLLPNAGSLAIGSSGGLASTSISLRDLTGNV
ncbi:MAG: hypothetical protein L3J94_03550 [Gammaproteobacteria bacterium]|nr:hypothetical protein [Gammaproteobacteria bacterium]